MRRPAFSASGAIVSSVLAREHFRRRHQRRLRAGFDRDRHGEQRDDRLARADVALQQPQHAARRGHVRLDLAQGLALRAGQREGERVGDRWRGCGRRP